MQLFSSQFPELFLNQILFSLIALFVFVNLLFLISVVTKRNDVADVFWGPGILLSSFVFLVTSQDPSIAMLVTFILISLWALRIFLHIGSRFLHKKEEDFRYKNWREKWKYFYIRSYFQIYILQGFLMFIMSLSIFSLSGISFAQGLGISSPILNIIFIFMGSVIAIFGLVFEMFADLQLNKFLKDLNFKKQNNIEIKTYILDSGLWKYTRHPNYFGEITFWFGVLIISIPYANFLSLIPFGLIVFLLLFVSGIPMLEEKYKNDKDFIIYKSKTPALIPDLFR